MLLIERIRDSLVWSQDTKRPVFSQSDFGIRDSHPSRGVGLPYGSSAFPLVLAEYVLWYIAVFPARESLPRQFGQIRCWSPPHSLFKELAAADFPGQRVQMPILERPT